MNIHNACASSKQKYNYVVSRYLFESISSTYLKKILLRAGPLGAEPVVVAIVGAVSSQQIQVRIEGEVDPREVEG